MRAIAALPGFGEMKIKALGAVLAKRFGIEVAEGSYRRIPPWATWTSAALEDYQAAKRLHKAEWSAVRAQVDRRRLPGWRAIQMDDLYRENILDH